MSLSSFFDLRSDMMSFDCSGTDCLNEEDDIVREFEEEIARSRVWTIHMHRAHLRVVEGFPHLKCSK